MKNIEKSLAVFCLATYGEGDPTDNAMEFWEWIQGDVDLAGLNYAVSEIWLTMNFYFFSFYSYWQNEQRKWKEECNESWKLRYDLLIADNVISSYCHIMTIGYGHKWQIFIVAAFSKRFCCNKNPVFNILTSAWLVFAIKIHRNRSENYPIDLHTVETNVIPYSTSNSNPIKQFDKWTRRGSIVI